MPPTPSTHAQDVQLVSRTLRGDPGARSELVRRLEIVPRMVAQQSARLGARLGDDELRDVAQEVLLAVWRKLERFRGDGPLEAWVFRFCFLEVRAHRRRQRRLGVSIDESVSEELTVPDDVRGRGWEFESLYRGLARLPEEQAEVIRLRHFGECSFQEVAQRCGAAVGAVKSMYYRGMLKLRDRVDPRELSADEEAAR